MPDTPRPLNGEFHRLPQSEPVTAARIAPLVAALGPGWMNCAQVLPWQDDRSVLRYMVYSPAYIGSLLVCRFDLYSPARWWHEGMQVGISGVTHWRLATETDQDFSELDAPVVVTTPNAEALAQLLHWWGWYRKYKGSDELE